MKYTRIKKATCFCLLVFGCLYASAVQADCLLCCSDASLGGFIDFESNCTDACDDVTNICGEDFSCNVGFNFSQEVPNTFSDGNQYGCTTTGMFQIMTPTQDPTSEPTTSPTKSPTKDPTSEPTTSPTKNPTKRPTSEPTTSPTKNPTSEPTTSPTKNPTRRPTSEPTTSPTKSPTINPTASPTTSPTENPTTIPTENPTTMPSSDPTTSPTSSPTITPSSSPTYSPTGSPVSGNLAAGGIVGIFMLVSSLFIIAVCFYRRRQEDNFILGDTAVGKESHSKFTWPFGSGVATKLKQYTFAAYYDNDDDEDNESTYSDGVVLDYADAPPAPPALDIPPPPPLLVHGKNSLPESSGGEGESTLENTSSKPSKKKSSFLMRAFTKASVATMPGAKKLTTETSDESGLTAKDKAKVRSINAAALRDRLQRRRQRDRKGADKKEADEQPVAKEKNPEKKKSGFIMLTFPRDEAKTILEKTEIESDDDQMTDSDKAKIRRINAAARRDKLQKRRQLRGQKSKMEKLARETQERRARKSTNKTEGDSVLTTPESDLMNLKTSKKSGYSTKSSGLSSKTSKSSLRSIPIMKISRTGGRTRVKKDIKKTVNLSRGLVALVDQIEEDVHEDDDNDKSNRASISELL